MSTRKSRERTAEELVFLGLCQQWYSLAPGKWQEERERLGHWVGLEAGFMHAEDERRRAICSNRVQAWTVAWFKERGWFVQIEMHPDGEQFRPLPLHEPNVTITFEEGAK